MVACGVRRGSTPEGVYERFQQLYPVVLDLIIDGQVTEETTAEGSQLESL